MYLYNFYKKFDLGFTELLKLFNKDEEIIIINNIDDYNDYSQDFIGIFKEYNKNNLTIVVEYKKGNYVKYRNFFNIDDNFDDLLFVKELKNKIKNLIYEILAKEKNKNLPWGILTGIRPGIIVHRLMDSLISKDEILNILKKKYKISNEKARLIYKVANNERDIILNTKIDEVSLYVGIPFCNSRCGYCSFVSHIINNNEEDLLNLYVDALSNEINEVTSIILSKDIKVQTIYFGGGTPTVLNIYMLERIFDLFEKKLGLKNIDEITFEAGRSDTVDKEKLNFLKNVNIDRICLNPQTLNNNTLIKVGRNHTVNDFKEKFELIRNMGFKNINSDIILGLPGEGIKEVKGTFDILADLKPDSVTIHSLALKRASKMKEVYKNNLFLRRDEGELIFEYALLRTYEMELTPYYLYRQKNSTANMENIGFSKFNKRCLYNIQMIEDNQTVIGLGAGSSTKIIDKNKDKFQKFYNLKNVFEYIKRIEEQVDKKKYFVKKYLFK